MSISVQYRPFAACGMMGLEWLVVTVVAVSEPLLLPGVWALQQ